MHYVYVLISDKDKELYTGCTNDLKNRLVLHNSGKVSSTKNRIPFKLIHYEAYLDKRDAFIREQWLKTGYGRKHLNKTLSNYLSGVKNSKL